MYPYGSSATFIWTEDCPWNSHGICTLICPGLTKRICPGKLFPPPSKLTETRPSDTGRDSVLSTRLESARSLPKIEMYDPGAWAPARYGGGALITPPLLMVGERRGGGKKY